MVITLSLPLGPLGTTRPVYPIGVSVVGLARPLAAQGLDLSQARCMLEGNRKAPAVRVAGTNRTEAGIIVFFDPRRGTAERAQAPRRGWGPAGGDPLGDVRGLDPGAARVVRLAERFVGRRPRRTGRPRAAENARRPTGPLRRHPTSSWLKMAGTTATVRVT